MTDVVEEGPLDYTYPLGQPPTPLQERFADWLRGDEVGYDPNAAKSKLEAFNEGVRLSVALRIPYQASDANREATAQERAANAAKREAARIAREEKLAARAAAAESKAAAPVAEAAPAAAPKPAKAAKAAAKVAPSAPAAAPTTRPAPRRAPARRAAAPAAPAEAPF
jgi:hypothetical protein